jgi:hypothetical protein
VPLLALDVQLAVEPRHDLVHERRHFVVVLYDVFHVDPPCVPVVVPQLSLELVGTDLGLGGAIYTRKFDTDEPHQPSFRVFVRRHDAVDVVGVGRGDDHRRP